MTKLFAALALSFSLSLSFVFRVTAQSETPPPSRTGTVYGQIANGTGGGEIPSDLALMLHAWDDKGETVMLDGKADSSGAFRFENVPMQDGWVFAAMLSYKDVTFFSKTGEVTLETKEITLPLTVYEASPDASTVRISQMHVLLDFVPGKVTVGEVYVLSNTGDRAVSGGVTLPDGKAATLQFALPAEANEVRFQGEDTTRFVITPEGFADTGAVLPGEDTAQVIVTYVLPYTSGMTLAHTVNQPVEAINVLTRADAGVTLAGDGLSAPTPSHMQTGETYNIYAAGPLTPGESLVVRLAGQPTYSMANGMNGTTPESSASTPTATLNRWAIPIAGGLLGMALIAVGVWWWRRSGKPEAEPQAAVQRDDWSGILQAIADLDEAHERGEVAEADYVSRRAELRGRARAILQAQEAAE
jgi:hypothetical protein